jgi:hypothetical protein
MSRQSPEPQSPVYTPTEVTAILNAGRDKPLISEAKVREIVRKEIAANTPDEDRFIPGARVDDNTMLIHKGIYDAVVEGRAVTHTAPVTMINPLRHVDQQKSA